MSGRPTVFVLTEQAQGERRVALVPADVRRLSSKFSVTVEQGAGISAGFADGSYQDEGAEIGTREAALSADLVLAVRAPADLQSLRPGSALVSLGGHDPHVINAVAARDLLHLALERVPRITRAQSMDVLSSQAAIAGYAAVIEGARISDTLLPMLSTAAGVVKPAKMIALGAGVAGLQAIATARRLGAVAHGFDVRATAREQVESLGAGFIPMEVPTALSANAEQGYAAEQAESQQAALRRQLAPVLASMRLIVTSAQVPGRPAPLLIDDQTLAGMLPGAVVVDLAAESGGNTSRTWPHELVTSNGVHILGAVHLANLFAADASRLFSGNLRALLEHLLDDNGQLRLTAPDPIITAFLGRPLTLQAA